MKLNLSDEWCLAAADREGKMTVENLSASLKEICKHVKPYKIDGIIGTYKSLHEAGATRSLYNVTKYVTDALEIEGIGSGEIEMVSQLIYDFFFNVNDSNASPDN